MMLNCFDQIKFYVNEMLDRIRVVLIENGVDESTVLMKIGVFRNYDQGIDKVYQESQWETDSKNLKEFLVAASCSGGWEREALEVGLWKATGEIEAGLSQVIIIGDAAANTADEMSRKQNDNFGRNYWDEHLPGLQESSVYVEQLQQKGIPIHTLYLQDRAKEQFEQFSDSTCGESNYLDMNSPASADLFVETVNVMILKSKRYPPLLESYRKSYGLKFS